MPELDDAALVLLLEALTDRNARRRLIGRLRPLLAGRPHPIVCLPRRRRPGLLAQNPPVTDGTDFWHRSPYRRLAPPPAAGTDGPA